MLEEKLGKQLRTSIYMAIGILAIFFACSIGLSIYLHNSRQELVQAQTIAEAEEYKKRILKQIDWDARTLRTFAGLIGQYSDPEEISRQMVSFSENSNFITIMYYRLDSDIMLYTDGEAYIPEEGMEAISPHGAQAVYNTLHTGEETISPLFQSDISGGQVFAYTVPVYLDGMLVGAVTASDDIEIFSDIISGNTVLGGGGYIHLINSQGEFLVRSPYMIVQENIRSFFDGPYLPTASRADVSNSLKTGERVFSSFKYDGVSYPFMLEPLGINDWYLFCVNTGEGLVTGAGASTLIVQLTFIGLFLLLSALMLRGYQLLRNYNNDLLGFAYYDQLTGAENMTRFRQRLSKALDNSRGSVVALSVRQFTFINEIFGAEKAAELLCQMKDIADRHMTKEEFFCRDNRDRFYFFLRETDKNLLRIRIEQLMADICANADIGRRDYHLTLYSGIAISAHNRDGEKAAETLMTRVQFAVEKSRFHYDTPIWFFDENLHRVEELENYVETHMNKALEEGEFKLFLQPKKNLRTNEIEGAEALVRWHTGDGKQIFPDEFIPLFEQNGFCVKLDIYMVEQACKQIRSWMDKGIKPIPISVNQSKLLFFEETYIGMLRELLKRYRVPADLIILEILEGLALKNEAALNEKIDALRSEGFRVSLDDFGTGYSSLNTLGKLKINELKLDKEFLANASNDKPGRVKLVMKSIVKLAATLGISTVAEGVETKGDEEFIKSIGCDIGQGYLYSRPISAQDFDDKYMSGPKMARAKL